MAVIVPYAISSYFVGCKNYMRDNIIKAVCKNSQLSIIQHVSIQSVEYSCSFASFFLPLGHFMFLSISERKQGEKNELTVTAIQFFICSIADDMSIDRKLQTNGK